MRGFYYVHFNDRVRSFGSGRRLVYLERASKRWVTIRCPHTLRTARFMRKAWDALHAHPHLVNPDKLVDQIETFERATNRSRTKVVDAMIQTAKEAWKEKA